MMSTWVTIRTLLILLFDALVLQWIKVPLALAMRFAWRPSYGDTLIREHIRSAPESGPTLPKITDAPLDALYPDGDALKWLGLLAAGGHKEAWEEILARVDYTGIYRYRPRDPRNETAAAVSGDMASGIVLAVVRKMNSGGWGSLKNKKTLAWLFRYIVFRGFSFPGNNTVDVGRIYQFFALTPTYKQCLVWLEIACRLNPESKLLAFWRRFIRIMFAPILAVNLVDYNIWLGRVVALAWYIPHSQYLFNLAGYELTGGKRYARALALLRKKYPWNADFREKRNVLHDLAAAKGTEAYAGEYKRYLSLRTMSFKDMTTEILPPAMLGQKYLHENDPFKPKECGQERRDLWPYDALAPHLPE